MDSPEIILNFSTCEAYYFDDLKRITTEDIPRLIGYFNDENLEKFLNQEQQHKIIDDLKYLKHPEQPQGIVSDMELAKGLSKILSLDLPRNWESELALRLILEEKFSDFQLDDKQIVNKDILKFLNFVNGLEKLNKNNSKSGSYEYKKKEDFAKKILTLFKMQSVKDFCEEKMKVIDKLFPSVLRLLKTQNQIESPRKKPDERNDTESENKKFPAHSKEMKLENCKTLEDYKGFIDNNRDIYNFVEVHCKKITNKNIDLIVAMLTFRKHNDWVRKNFGSQISDYFEHPKNWEGQTDKFYMVATKGIVNSVERDFQVLFANKKNVAFTLKNNDTIDLSYDKPDYPIKDGVKKIDIYLKNSHSDFCVVLYCKKK